MEDNKIMTLTEKVSYLKGMVEMAELADTKENKILRYIVDVLDEMALAIEDNDDCSAEMEARIDEIDEDLADLEDEIYGEDEEDPCAGCDKAEDSEDFADEDEEFYELECPACHETICISENMVDMGSIACPNCGTDLAFDFEESEEEEQPEA